VSRGSLFSKKISGVDNFTTFLAGATERVSLKFEPFPKREDDARSGDHGKEIWLPGNSKDEKSYFQSQVTHIVMQAESVKS
jgi:hypothetical protein